MIDLDSNLAELDFNLKSLQQDINIYRIANHDYIAPDINHKLEYLVNRISSNRNKLKNYREIAYYPDCEEEPNELIQLIKDYAKLADYLNELEDTEELTADINEAIDSLSCYNYLIPKDSLF